MPETVEALERHCPVEPLYVDVSRSVTAYFELLTELWRDSSTDLVIVEHDMVPHAHVWTAFQRCPHPWCGFAYPKDSQPELVALGCTRFRRSLIDTANDLPGRMAAHWNDWDSMPVGHWVRCDGHLDVELRKIPYVWRGETVTYQPHKHLPTVGHVNPGERSAP